MRSPESVRDVPTGRHRQLPSHQGGRCSGSIERCRRCLLKACKRTRRAQAGDVVSSRSSASLIHKTHVFWRWSVIWPSRGARRLLLLRRRPSLRELVFNLKCSQAARKGIHNVSRVRHGRGAVSQLSSMLSCPERPNETWTRDSACPCCVNTSPPPIGRRRQAATESRDDAQSRGVGPLAYWC